MKVIALICASLAILTMAAGTRAVSENPRPTQLMEGTWSCISATVNGNPLPPETVKLLRLTLTRDRYKTQKGNDVLFDSSYRLDPSQDPPHINILGTEGDLKGKEAQGIYSLAVDTLKLCYTMPGKKRPAAFESLPGSETHYMIWKRQNP